jgi:5-methyltetrahydrofolate--homocysteine methyltransferase
MENILERLKRGDVIVGDGALGTMLMQRGLKHGDPPEEFNLTKQNVLEEIAALYLDAGAEIISTNTFGASPLRLKQFSLEKKMEAINRNAVEAVRRAVRERAYVSGSVGPSSHMIKPLGDTDPEDVLSSYQSQIRALLAAGIDMICIETMMDVAEAKLAIEAALSLDPAIPVMVTMTFNKGSQGFFTLMGSSVKNASAALEKAGANIVGSNCGDGMESMVGIAREFQKCAHVPIAIQGNAGLPIVEGTNLIYSESPEFVAEKAKELLPLGVQLIGGCCGTRPEHIRAIRKVVDAHKRAR